MEWNSLILAAEEALKPSSRLYVSIVDAIREDHIHASKEVISRLNYELNEIMKDPLVAGLFVQGGATVQGGSPSDAAKMLAEYQRFTAQIIKESNISV